MIYGMKVRKNTNQNVYKFASEKSEKKELQNQLNLRKNPLD